MHSEPTPNTSAAETSAQTAATGTSVVAERLTARERRVLELIALGYTNEQIAAELAFSLSTIKADIGSILRKLGARNRAGAVALASRFGIFGQTFA
jgi:DNA-binding NarL/FixJ family response regulator